jgi:hypothetical protein
LAVSAPTAVPLAAREIDPLPETLLDVEDVPTSVTFPVADTGDVVPIVPVSTMAPDAAATYHENVALNVNVAVALALDPAVAFAERTIDPVPEPCPLTEVEAPSVNDPEAESGAEELALAPNDKDPEELTGAAVAPLPPRESDPVAVTGVFAVSVPTISIVPVPLAATMLTAVRRNEPST